MQYNAVSGLQTYKMADKILFEVSVEFCPVEFLGSVKKDCSSRNNLFVDNSHKFFAFLSGYPPLPGVQFITLRRLLLLLFHSYA